MTVVGKNYIFIHVPKSAGQSVTSRLAGLTKSVPGHAPLFYLPEETRKSRYAFGFVRNPWARMVSVYAFICNKPVRRNEDPEYQQMTRRMGFEAWLMQDAFFAYDDRLWKTGDLAPIQRRSQLFWVDDCDFVGKVETLDADFAHVAKAIGLKPRWRERFGPARSMPHRNKSHHNDYRSYFSDAAAGFVATHFAPEIERFGYSF